MDDYDENDDGMPVFSLNATYAMLSYSRSLQMPTSLLTKTFPSKSLNSITLMLSPRALVHSVLFAITEATLLMAATRAGMRIFKNKTSEQLKSMLNELIVIKKFL